MQLWLFAAALVVIAALSLARHGPRRRRRHSIFGTAMRAGLGADLAAALQGGTAGERRVSRALRANSGSPQIDNFVFEHRGWTVQIDHLLLDRDRVWVIETKQWAGVIRGSAHDESWTVRTRAGRIVPRQNPLRQNTWHCEALSAAFGVRTQSLVIMAGSARFAGGLPAGTVFLPELARYRLPRAAPHDAQPDVARAWARIVAVARSPRQAKLQAAHGTRMRQQPVL